MVNMAHELGLSVVAEGISGESDALELRQMGCEYVQSFMFGAPIPARPGVEDAQGAVSARHRPRCARLGVETAVLGVAGGVAEMGEVDADRGEDAVVFAVDVGVEEQVGGGRAGQLSRSPRSRFRAGRHPIPNSRAPSAHGADRGLRI